MNALGFVSVLVLAAGSAMAPTPAASQSDQSKPAAPPVVTSFDPAAMDLSADPCVDFYQYACGNWVKENPVPADQTRWVRSFSLVQQRNRYLLWKILDAAATDPKTTLQKQYGDFYAACMDTAAIEEKGLSPIKSSWAEIAKLKDVKQLPKLLSELENQGAPDGFFEFGVGQDEKNSSMQIAEAYQGGISLPDREYYISDSPHFVEIRSEYLAHMKKMFALAGDTPDAAGAEADAVLKIETAMAKAFLSRTELRNPASHYHIYTVADFQEMTPEFDWTTYFHRSGIRPFDTLNVATPDYFKALNGLLESEPLTAWKSYLRWHVLHGQAEYLPQAFFDENFDFFARTLAGQKQPLPRWQRCSSMTDHALGEAVGQDWVKQNFPPAAKESTEKLVADLEKSLGADIQTLPWMSDATKQAAEEKLKMIREKIGYPEKWKDYSSVKVSPTELVANVEHVAVFDRNFNYNKLGKPVDEKEWDMTPPTVNAYYDPSFNDINFPAGISAAAVLRLQGRSGGELRGHRRGDRARDDARLRRSGLASSTATATCATGGQRRTARRSTSGPRAWPTNTAILRRLRRRAIPRRRI